MEYRSLGRTGIKVSVIGLGTMTFGEQNSEAEGHEQLDCALDHGVNLVDTAEMYSVPPSAQTYGATERIIGTWLKKGGRRDRIVLATKVAGPGAVLGVSWVRGGDNRLDRANIFAAVDASLQRLQTDYIDIYQLHWPSRPTNFFGRLGYEHPEQVNSAQAVAIEETLAALGDLVRAGKIRHVGVSNETPWGVHRFLQLAAGQGQPRIVSIQNPYNLLNRTFEIGLAEMAIREEVALLAYSPLAFGVLSGKFLGGARPPESRIVRWSRFSRYTGEYAEQAVAAYAAVARRHGLDMAQMALAFARRQRFMTSLLIGATTMQQLQHNLASATLQLGQEVIRDIEAVHRAHPNPSP
ncbi:MAG TPA: NADP(H)-dependent aldo-keto reductase [Steroidobacteraceae bacterium]|nr:NADP(H)-dependent aldo-keto reductase [Steroidobacteraceae bacterium]